MRQLYKVLLTGFLSLSVPVLHGADSSSAWPRFRGPDAQGVADGQNLPERWDVKAGTNVRWKTEIPGLGHSSPVVWGDRVFLTTAVSDTRPQLVFGDEGGIKLADDRTPHSWRLISVDAKDGRILWSAEAGSGPPRAKRHVKASHANSTPATDGKTVVAILGSELLAFDFEGRPRWRADLGVLNPGLFGDASSEWGYASSPILFENLAIVQVDRHKDSYLAAFDLASGAKVWSIARDERPVWSTPLLHTADGRSELIVVGGYYDRAYDPRSGQELWRFKDEAEVKTPAPFASDGVIVFAGGYRGRPIFAMRPGGKGDLSLPKEAKSGPFLAWRSEPGGPYTTTPVAYRGLLYGARDEGILFAYDMANGGLVWRERSGATHAASPVASDGRIYVASEAGEILVVKAGRSFELLARNDMGEPTMATPAIASGTLFVRTSGHLYAIAELSRSRSAQGRPSSASARSRSGGR